MMTGIIPVHKGPEAAAEPGSVSDREEHARMNNRESRESGRSAERGETGGHATESLRFASLQAAPHNGRGKNRPGRLRFVGGRGYNPNPAAIPRLVAPSIGF